MGLFRRKRHESDACAASAVVEMLPGPSWMSAEDWMSRVVAYRRQRRSDAEIAVIAHHLEQRGPGKSRTTPQGRVTPRRRAAGVRGGGAESVVVRGDYVPSDREAEHLTRDVDGRPLFRLVDAGDRLTVWSPVGGGALVNPNGAGLRRSGLVATYAISSTHHASAYRAADLRPGRPVELRCEPDNPDDGNAVALYAPGARTPFGYVHRGRASALTRRLDAGENLAGVSLRGPGPHRADDSALLLIGSADDLAAMLEAGNPSAH